MDKIQQPEINTVQEPNRGENLLKTVNVEKSFYIGTPGEVKILKTINVAVEKGDFVIIFGPSGCGKSTLLHTILGLESPTAGSVLLEGTDFYSLTEDKRATYRRHKVGIIYQQPLWISSLDIGENVIFTLRLLNLDDQQMNTRVDEVLTTVGMQEWKNYRPQELSSGQQQKVSLARALSINPILIVADEPTGNLDTVSGQQLVDHFTELNKKGITIIMVTHDLEYLKYGNKIVHMIDGMVVEQYVGKPGQSFNRNAQGKKAETEDGTFTANVRDPKFLAGLKGEHDGKILQYVTKVDGPKDVSREAPLVDNNKVPDEGNNIEKGKEEANNENNNNSTS